MLVADVNLSPVNLSPQRMTTVASRSAGEIRKLNDSSFYLDTAFVDQYAREVQKRLGTENPPARVDPEQSDEDNEQKDNRSEEGDPADGTPSAVISQCTDDGKAAGSEEKKPVR